MIPKQLVISAVEHEIEKKLYITYFTESRKNHPNSYIFSFDEILQNIYNGLLEYTNEKDITENLFIKNLYSVLKAMVYNAENSLEEMIERAESSYSERYKQMTAEQKEISDKYRLKIK